MYLHILDLTPAETNFSLPHCCLNMTGTNLGAWKMLRADRGRVCCSVPELCRFLWVNFISWCRNRSRPRHWVTWWLFTGKLYPSSTGPVGSKFPSRRTARSPLAGHAMTMTSLKPIKCSDSFRIRLKVTLGKTLGIGLFGNIMEWS